MAVLREQAETLLTLEPGGDRLARFAFARDAGRLRDQPGQERRRPAGGTGPAERQGVVQAADHGCRSRPGGWRQCAAGHRPRRVIRISAWPRSAIFVHVTSSKPTSAACRSGGWAWTGRCSRHGGSSGKRSPGPFARPSSPWIVPLNPVRISAAYSPFRPGRQGHTMPGGDGPFQPRSSRSTARKYPVLVVPRPGSSTGAVVSSVARPAIASRQRRACSTTQSAEWGRSRPCAEDPDGRLEPGGAEVADGVILSGLSGTAPHVREGAGGARHCPWRDGGQGSLREAWIGGGSTRKIDDRVQARGLSGARRASAAARRASAPADRPPSA